MSASPFCRHEKTFLGKKQNNCRNDSEESVKAVTAVSGLLKCLRFLWIYRHFIAALIRAYQLQNGKNKVVARSTTNKFISRSNAYREPN